MKIITAYMLLIFSICIANAQENADIIPAPSAQIEDTSFVKNAIDLQEDSLRYEDITDVSNIEAKPHSPKRAAILSAALPGLGQIYNKKYWKVGLVYGGIAGLTIFFNYANRNHRLFRNAYHELLVNDQLTSDILKAFPSHEGLLANGGRSDLLNNYELNKDNFRKYRDQTVIYFVIFYILNIVDANVDAYFLKYDVNENLALNARPIIGSSLAQNYAGFQFNLTLK